MKGTMAREDIPPLPLRPPKKRKAMEQTLDVHLAMWSSQANLLPSDKRRVEEERERRKRLRVQQERLGILVGPEGSTPEQLKGLAEYLTGHYGVVDSIWHVRTPGPVHGLCKSFGVPVQAVTESDFVTATRTVIRNCTKIAALPRGEVAPLWDDIRYARHRNLSVVVFMPNGERR